MLYKHTHTHAYRDMYYINRNKMHLDKHLDKYNKIFNRKSVYQFNQFDFFITGIRNCQRPEVIQLELKASKMRGNLAIEEL